MAEDLKLHGIDQTKAHRWSGWPGAYCLYCGSEDPVENALALNWFDPETGEFDTIEHRNVVQEALLCHADESVRKQVDEQGGYSPNTTENAGNGSPDAGEVS